MTSTVGFVFSFLHPQSIRLILEAKNPVYFVKHLHHTMTNKINTIIFLRWTW